jgi:hypothetical protein
MIPISRSAMWSAAGSMIPSTDIAPAISIPLRTARWPDAWKTGAVKRSVSPKKMSHPTVSMP